MLAVGLGGPVVVRYEPRRAFVAWNGSDTADGHSQDQPFATLAAAATALRKWGGGTIFVDAPITNQLTSEWTWTHEVPIVVEGLNGAEWYMDAQNVRNTCVLVHGNAGLVTLRRGRFKNAMVADVLVGLSSASAGTGKAVCEDCIATASGSNGFATQGVFTSLDLVRCDGSGNTNDGFSAHGSAGVAGVVNMTDCTGSGNGDEWASPHDDTILNIDGGSCTGSGHGALAAANNAEMNVTGLAVSGAYTSARENGEGGITYIDTTTSGSLTDVTITGTVNAPNLVIRPPSSAVTRTRVTSTGGNGPDEIAA